MRLPAATSREPKNYLLFPIYILLVVLVVANFMVSSSAVLLGNRSLKMSTSEAGATAQYEIAFSFPGASMYGSLDIQICANDPIPGQPCTAPNGFTMSQAVLASQSGTSGFSILPGATANHMVLGRVPAPTPAGPVSYDLQQIINPADAGTFYVRLQAYASADGSGTATWDGGLAFAIINSLTISATVPPYLIFCTGITISNLNCSDTTGDYIDFGELSASKTSSGSSQMVAATNAEDGYNISVSGPTMTSGTNTIASLANNDVSRPGTPQFGLNLHANSAPASGVDPTGPGVAMPAATYFQPNSYRFVSGETLVQTPKPDDARRYTTSYIVNVPKTQAAGIYVTTITYTCLGSF